MILQSFYPGTLSMLPLDDYSFTCGVTTSFSSSRSAFNEFDEKSCDKPGEPSLIIVGFEGANCIDLMTSVLSFF
jgi:hypothetical protein